MRLRLQPGYDGANDSDQRLLSRLPLTPVSPLPRERGIAMLSVPYPVQHDRA